MKRYAGYILMLVVLIAADVLLFSRYELVWPFFLMPYVVLLIVYLIVSMRRSEGNALLTAIYMLVVIPVFAGFVMSVAWMIKINFWGELIGSIIK